MASGECSPGVEASRPMNSSESFQISEILLRNGELRRAFYSTVTTLTLGILGGAVLAVPHAFTLTGVICGFLVMLAVAAANAYTCDLLLRQAQFTGTKDYQSLALSIGGKWWKLATEISIVVLLAGSAIGNIQQVSEAASAAFDLMQVSHIDSRVLTLVFVMIVVAPLCLARELRQLEVAARIGTAIVVCLAVVIAAESIKHGLPAVASGELAVGSFPSLGFATQAMATFGFAFYIQPMLMPLLAEVPAGETGVKLLSYSVRTVVLGTSFFIYSAAGFFGAARYGWKTAGNILENKWLGGGVAQGILNFAVSIYLASVTPLFEFPTRQIILGYLNNREEFSSRISVTASFLVFCTGISIIWPNNSSLILTITGATGVCMVSYLIPIANHLKLIFFSTDSETLLPSRKYEVNKSSLVFAVGVPILVLGVGIVSSLAALVTLAT